MPLIMKWKAAKLSWAYLNVVEEKRELLRKT